MSYNVDEPQRAFFCTIWLKSIVNMGFDDLIDLNGFPKDNTGELLLDSIIDMFQNTGKKRFCGGACCVSADNNFHIHLGVYCENKIKLHDLSEILGNAHIELQRGNKKQLVAYILKQGDFEEKGEQILYSSNLDNLGDNQGKRNDLNKLYELISSGMTTSQIVALNPTFMNKIDIIDRVRELQHTEKYKSIERDIEVVYLYGKTDSGKTYTVFHDFGFDNVYRVSDYRQPFDGYHGQKVLFLDEYNNNFNIEYLLKLLDKYPMELFARYYNRIACFDKVFIASNLPLEKQYYEVKKDNEEQYNAFIRRISEVRYYRGKNDLDIYTSVEMYLNRHKVEKVEFLQVDFDASEMPFI